MHDPHLLNEMVTELETYDPPLSPAFIAKHCQTPNDVYLAADTIRNALMVYAELAPSTRTLIVERAKGKRALRTRGETLTVEG